MNSILYYLGLVGRWGIADGDGLRFKITVFIGPPAVENLDLSSLGPTSSKVARLLAIGYLAH